jgi:hypothetical protein
MKSMDHNYDGAVIRSVRLGPRHELTLELDIWPKHNTATDGTGAKLATVRFGGISNYDEVGRAFENLNVHESLHYMRDALGSKPTRRLIEIAFDRTEQHIRIIANHVTE